MLPYWPTPIDCVNNTLTSHHILTAIPTNLTESYFIN